MTRSVTHYDLSRVMRGEQIRADACRWVETLGVEPKVVDRNQVVVLSDDDTVRIRVFDLDANGDKIVHRCEFCDDWHMSKRDIRVPLNGNTPEKFGLEALDVDRDDAVDCGV